MLMEKSVTKKGGAVTAAVTDDGRLVGTRRLSFLICQPEWWISWQQKKKKSFGVDERLRETIRWRLGKQSALDGSQGKS